MKNVILSLGFLCLVTSTFAQDISTSSFKISKVNVSIGSDQDMLLGMNYNYFVNQVPLDEEFQLRDNTFSDIDIASGYCENHSYSIGFTMTHDRFKNFEWRNAILLMEGRGDGIYYEVPDGHISFSSTQDEYGLESVVLYKKELPAGFKLYAGGGVNMGLSVNNTICVNGSGYVEKATRGSDGTVEREYKSINECYQAGNMFNQRLLGEFGLAWTFRDKYELGFNIKNGFGFRAGAGHITRTNIDSANLSFAYYLNQ